MLILSNSEYTKKGSLIVLNARWGTARLWNGVLVRQDTPLNLLLYKYRKFPRHMLMKLSSSVVIIIYLQSWIDLFAQRLYERIIRPFISTQRIKKNSLHWLTKNNKIIPADQLPEIVLSIAMSYFILFFNQSFTALNKMTDKCTPNTKNILPNRSVLHHLTEIHVPTYASLCRAQWKTRYDGRKIFNESNKNALYPDNQL